MKTPFTKLCLTAGLSMTLLAACSDQKIIQSVTVDKKLIDILKPDQVRAIANTLKLEGNKVAVMPFSVLADKPEYQKYGIGMSDTVTTSLAGLKEFTTIDRSLLEAALSEKSVKFDGQFEQAKAIDVCRELGVGTLIVGSLQIENGQYRISYRIINTSSGQTQKALQFNAKSIFEAQDLLAQYIAAIKGIELNAQQQLTISKVTQGTQNTGAYDLYLQAREKYFASSTPKALQACVDLLDQVLKADPGFTIALAFKAEVLLAMTNTLLAAESLGISSHSASYSSASFDAMLKQAAEAADQAFKQAPELGNVYRAQGRVETYRKNYSSAILKLKRALELNPNDYETYFYLFEAEGGNDPKLKQPDNPNLLKTLDLNPRFARAYFSRGLIYVSQSRFSEAIQDFEQSLKFSRSDFENYFAYFMIGQVNMTRQNIPETVKNLGLALEKLEAMPDKNEALVRTLEGMTYGILGGGHFLSYNFPSAETSLLRAIELLSYDKSEMNASLQNMIGKFYQTLGLVQKTENKLLQAAASFNMACSYGVQDACSLSSPTAPQMPTVSPSGITTPTVPVATETNAPTAELATFSGKVFDESGNPLDGVTVSVRSLDAGSAFSETQESISGVYAFRNAPVGSELELKVSKTGYASRSQRIRVVSSSLNPDADNRFDFMGEINAMNDQPEVIAITPKDGASISSDRGITITFSEPMSHAEVERLFNISVQYSDGSMKVWSNQLKVLDNPFTFKWNTDSSEVFITNNGKYPLDPGYTYLVGFAEIDYSPEKVHLDLGTIKDATGVSRSGRYFRVGEKYYNVSRFTLKN